MADVETKSSAKLAGILPGDVIISINNKDVSNFNDIDELFKDVKERLTPFTQKIFAEKMSDYYFK